RHSRVQGTPVAWQLPELGFLSTTGKIAENARGHVMRLKPLGDRVVVRRLEAAEKTAGGIYLPETAKNKPQRGKVEAVGPGRLLKDGSRRPLQVKVGDTVLFTTWAGDEFHEGKSTSDILLMREEDILAVLDE